ncbi:hypothetical protein ACFLTP_04315 [Chloroflexota bacterium]
MQSSLIGKIEKAKRYSREKDRVKFTGFSVQFQGEHDTYITGYKDSGWHCSCHFYSIWGLCSHTMALEKMLGDMLPEKAITTLQNTVS